MGGLSAFSQLMAPASATGPGFLTNSGQTVGFAGGPKVWSITSVAGAEIISRYVVTGDSTGKLEIANKSGSASVFKPAFVFTSAGTNQARWEEALITTDSTTNACALTNYATVGGAAVVTRPLQEWRNNLATVLSLLPLNSGANAALSWGTQADGTPTFTNRSSGVRLVLYNAINGSQVDPCIGTRSSGAVLWSAIPQATASYLHEWYAGQTKIGSLRGDGQRTYTGGAVRKARIALTTPVSIAVTDDIVFVKLTTPGPVAVNWPASPVAGQEYAVVDATGDANTNNITHTPAAGNFNGGATKVQNVAYSRFTGAYTGAEWIGA